MKTCGLLSLLAICISLFTQVLSAQNTSGTITGRITDSTGATISGARVTILNTNSSDKREITTDASGDYTAPFLLRGSYNLISEK